ncbi:WD40 repeat domain-containing protein [Streptomyces sp. NPDC094438]|uniref:WD40 repeat domain-containing protein n=1 Tax=Streptomyces sp. NPDC094438 TaxID=3366061 RepID=UPI00380F3193
MTAHTDTVWSAVFTPDWRRLATASADKTIRLWNIEDRHRPVVTATMTGHTDGLYSAAFTPDGRTLANASIDHTVRLWYQRTT